MTSLLCGSLEIEFVTQLNFSQIDQAEIHSSFRKQHTVEIDIKGFSGSKNIAFSRH